MAKVRISISIDESIKKELDARENINNSGLINDLLKQYFRDDARHTGVNEMQTERLREQAEQLQTEAEAKRRQAEAVITLLESKQEEVTG